MSKYRPPLSLRPTELDYQAIGTGENWGIGEEAGAKVRPHVLGNHIVTKDTKGLRKVNLSAILAPIVYLSRNLGNTWCITFLLALLPASSTQLREHSRK